MTHIMIYVITFISFLQLEVSSNYLTNMKIRDINQVFDMVKLLTILLLAQRVNIRRLCATGKCVLFYNSRF